MTAGFYTNYHLNVFGDGITTVFTATLTQNPVLNAGASLTKGGLELGTPVSVTPGGAGYTVSLSGHTLTVTFATAPSSVTSADVTVVYNG